MTHVNPTSRRAAGITLIEMMVALAITTFVVLVVNQLFNGVIQTVGRGTQAGEILQRSRAFDEQIATETELIISGGRQPATEPYDWYGRMVGPKGREPGQPGGFLVVVQRLITNVPVTIDDQLKLNYTNNVRSDQLMFIYDQQPMFDQTGKKRLPPLAPANINSYGGDMINSINSDYVRIWYGHVLQVPDGVPADTYPPASISQIDLGNQTADNPNALAQDWVLGRHAMFLMKDGINPITSVAYTPFGIHINGVTAFSGLNGISGSPARTWNGIADVSSATLQDLTGNPLQVVGMPVASATQYQAQILSVGHAFFPLLTSGKPASGMMRPIETAASHTYFMGGVSDFIVEWAGDVVTGESFIPTAASIAAGPDGELDRDEDGRIKWYTHSPYSNPVLAVGGLPANNINAPVTYPVPTRPSPNQYPPYNTTPPARADAAFVWQHEGSPGFTSWPWMLRIRYRLHDRRGQFEGREITVNTATRETEPEAGAWFETIIPVNSQGL